MAGGRTLTDGEGGWGDATTHGSTNLGSSLAACTEYITPNGGCAAVSKIFEGQTLVREMGVSFVAFQPASNSYRNRNSQFHSTSKQGSSATEQQTGRYKKQTQHVFTIVLLLLTEHGAVASLVFTEQMYSVRSHHSQTAGVKMEASSVMLVGTEYGVLSLLLLLITTPLLPVGIEHGNNSANASNSIAPGSGTEYGA